MGARPLAFTLALTLPAAEPAWLAQFSEGLAAAADHFQIALVGGDTSRGPLTISIQVHGLVAGQCLRRDTAVVGDSVFVTGTLGDAALALPYLLAAQPPGQPLPDEAQRAFLQQRFYRPDLRLALAESLVGVASAAIDLSDGLLADLGHLCRRSGVAAEIHASCLPASDCLLALTAAGQRPSLQLTGGDDYELCFTAPPTQREQLQEFAEMLDVRITEVGRLLPGTGVTALDASGRVLNLPAAGYQHFGV